MKMKRKGYIFSMFVFMIFIFVFVMVITGINYQSIVQETDYETITVLKMSSLANNIKELRAAGASCANIEAGISSDQFDVSVQCGGVGDKVLIKSKTGLHEMVIGI
jgi:hypothetical protein